METSVNQSGVPAFKQISTGLQALRTAEIKITFQQKKKKSVLKRFVDRKDVDAVLRVREEFLGFVESESTNAGTSSDIG